MRLKFRRGVNRLMGDYMMLNFIKLGLYHTFDFNLFFTKPIINVKDLVKGDFCDSEIETEEGVDYCKNNIYQVKKIKEKSMVVKCISCHHKIRHRGSFGHIFTLYKIGVGN